MKEKRRKQAAMKQQRCMWNRQHCAPQNGSAAPQQRQHWNRKQQHSVKKRKECIHKRQQSEQEGPDRPVAMASTACAIPHLGTAHPVARAYPSQPKRHTRCKYRRSCSKQPAIRYARTGHRVGDRYLLAGVCGLGFADPYHILEPLLIDTLAQYRAIHRTIHHTSTEHPSAAYDSSVPPIHRPWSRVG
eukprot:1103942-Rhodomonas_salina.2